jgi:hypothetical protein
MHLHGRLAPVPKELGAMYVVLSRMLVEMKRVAAHLCNTEADKVVRPGGVPHPTRQWVGYLYSVF